MWLLFCGLWSSQWQINPALVSLGAKALVPCSSMDSSMGFRWNSFPPLISMVCKGSAYHLTVAEGEWLLRHAFPVPSSLTWVSQPRHGCLSPVPLFSPKQKEAGQQILPLKYVAHGGADWLDLGQMQVWLGPRETSGSYRGQNNSCLSHYENPAGHKSITTLFWNSSKFFFWLTC